MASSKAPPILTQNRALPQEEEDLPSLVLATLVVLLLLLAALIWVAFCMAVHRTARRMAMFKRQRRTQTIIAAAISRAVSEGARTADAALSSNASFSFFGGRTTQRPQEALPTYEEALSMEAAPPSISIIGGLPPRPRQQVDPPAYARESKQNRVLRIAPERPGCSSSALPPSYDSVTLSSPISLSPSITSSPSRVPVYTVPRRRDSTDV